MIQVDHIRLFGQSSAGILTLGEEKIEWKDKGNAIHKIFEKSILRGLKWAHHGTRSQLIVSMQDTTQARFEGFLKGDVDPVSRVLMDYYQQKAETELTSNRGSTFGELTVEDKTFRMNDNFGHKSFDLSLENVAQCVIGTNKSEMEIQFHENDADKEEDSLVQVTFHFPVDKQGRRVDPETCEPIDGSEEENPAEAMQKAIMSAAALRNVSGNVIIEFTKEQAGNFVSPRGRYAMQLTGTFLRMQGPQYDYKIMYTDIKALFLLPRPEPGRMAFVISLAKPVRQGQQKYPHLVLETDSGEESVSINLSEEDCKSKYDGQLEPSMTGPMSTLIARTFKVITQTTVFIPKQFVSSRDTHCIKCSVKSSEGMLYPLAKMFLFINKPTLVLAYADVDFIEFERINDKMSATRNFDIKIYVKAGSASSQGLDSSSSVQFSSIEKAELMIMLKFLETKKIATKLADGEALNTESLQASVSGASQQKASFGGADDEDSEEDDEDYKGGESSSQSDNSDDSDEDGSDAGAEAASESSIVEGKEKEKKEKKERKEKQRKEGVAIDEDIGDDSAAEKPKKKKAKRKKDPNAPKNALSAYMFFSKEMRPKVLDQTPGLAVTEVAKVIGAKWKELDEEDKAPFEKMNQEDKVRYQKEMETYQDGKATTAEPAEALDESDVDSD
jgi:structure-specific recognition protein 1